MAAGGVLSAEVFINLLTSELLILMAIVSLALYVFRTLALYLLERHELHKAPPPDVLWDDLLKDLED